MRMTPRSIPVGLPTTQLVTITIRSFSRRFYPKRLTSVNKHNAHRRLSQPSKGTASSSGAVWVKCLTQGHINTQVGGAGDQNSNLSVTRQLPAT